MRLESRNSSVTLGWTVDCAEQMLGNRLQPTGAPERSTGFACWKGVD